MSSSSIDKYFDKVTSELVDQKMEEVRAATDAKIAELNARIAGPHTPPPVEQAGVLRTAGDVGIKLAQGAVDLGQSVVGLGSLVTGGLIGEGMHAIGYDPERTNQILGEYLSDSQKAADAKVQQADGFIASIKAYLKNPRSIMGGIAESTPGMLGGMGVAGAAARRIGLKAAELAGGMETVAGQKAFQTAIEEAGAKLSALGAVTEGAQSAGQIADQAQAAGREYSDYALPALGAGALTAGIGAVSNKFFGDAATDFATGAKTLKGSRLAKLAKEGFSEGVTEEMPQSAQEQYFTNMAMGKDDLMEGVGNAAGSGLVVGAAMGVGMGGLHRSPTAKNSVKTTQDRQKFKEAAAKNDVSAYIDPQSPDYDLSKAVGVLLGHAMQDSTTPEVRQANLKQAGDIVAKLEEDHAKALQDVEAATPTGLDELQGQLSAVQDLLKKTDPQDKAKIATFNTMVEDLTAEIADASNNDKAKVAQTRASKLEQQLAAVRASDLGRQLDSARARFEGLATVAEPQATTAEVQDLLKQANSTDHTTATEPIQRIINLSMTQPDALSAKQAKYLANNKANGLTDEQRTHLRIFSEARMAENALSSTDKVQNDVLIGSDKNVGIVQYRSRIGAAIAAGNQAIANRQLGLLERFTNDQTSKAEAAQKAMTLGKGNQIVKLTDGTGWQVVLKEQALDEDKLRKNGGLTMDSPRLVENIQKEATALQATLAEMKSATQLKFGVQSVSSAKQSTPSKNNLPSKTVEDAARPSQGNGPSAAQAPSPASKLTSLQQAEAKHTRQEALVKEAQAKYEQRKAEREAKAKAKAAATEQQAVTSEASAAPAAEVATPAAVEKKDNQSSPVASPASEPSAPIAVADAPAQGTVPSLASATETQVEVKPTGLKVFRQKVTGLNGKMQEIFRQVNPIAQFLTQRTNSERYKTRLPLVAQPDFFTAIKNKTVTPFEFIEEGSKENTTPEVRHALRNMYENLKSWLPLIEQNIAVHNGNVDFKTEDMMQYLLEQDEQGKPIRAVEENVRTAIAYGAYSWFLEQAHSPEWKTMSDIAAMHGKDKETFVSDEGVAKLREMAHFEDRIIYRIGDRIVQALGLQAGPNAPQNILPRLRMALGTHALLLLEHPDVKLIERVSLPTKEVESYFGVGISDNEDSSITEDEIDNVAKLKESRNSYIKLWRDEDGLSLSGLGKGIKDADVGSRGAVDRLFGSDKAGRMPSTKPVEFTQKFAKGTRQLITKMQRKAIQETMNTPHTVIPEMMQLFSHLGRDTVLRIAGARDVDDGTVHSRYLRSVEAQNNNLINQYDNAWELITSYPEGTEFFVEQQVGKNFRGFFSNQALNQQTSKIHRVLFARPEWKTTIKLNDEAMVNEFKIAVAMSLGLKTDQQRNVTTLEEFNKVLKDQPGIMQAVELIRIGTLNDDPSVWTDEAKQLVEKVAGGKERMMSLQALVAYAKYQEALIDQNLMHKTGQDAADHSFEVTLLVGVDGKTNGPMLSHLALGAARDIDSFYALLNRGGFYSTEEGQPDHFSEWYERATSMDLYEDLGSRIVERVQGYVMENSALWALRKANYKESKKYFTEDHLKAVEMVTKQLIKDGKATKDMRNLTKVPLTSFAFGSSLKKSIQNMQDSFIDSFYSNIEKMAANKENGVKVRTYLTQINTLMDLGDYKLKSPVDVAMPIEALLKFELDHDQEVALRKAFNQVIGNSVREEMNSYFGTFMDRRTKLNNTIQSAYQVFEAAYASARVKEMERLMDEGEIASRISKANDGVETRVPLHDLTQAQEQALHAKVESLMPTMHSAYSIEANDLSSGLQMSKSKVTISDSPLYKNKTYTYKKVDHANGTSVAHLSSKAQTRVEQSPGVAGAAYSIHSTDSSIMHQMLLRVKGSLNVHDEGSNGVHKTRDVARGLNQATVETLLEYSPARESVFMLERVITNMAKQIREGTVDATAVKPLLENWANNYNKFAEDESEYLTPEQAADVTLQDAVTNAYMADHMRLTAYSMMKSADQYVWEGGQFNDEKAMATIRKRAEQKLAQLVEKGGSASKATLVDLAFLKEQYAKVKDQEITRPTWLDMKFKGEEQEADPVKPSKAVHNGVAVLGKPIVKSNPKLVEAFAAKPVMAVSEVVAVLRPLISNDFEKKLLAQLERTVNGKLEVRYVTKDTLLEQLKAPLDDNAAGAYQATSAAVTDQAIYVLSPDFVRSNLNTELLLHELTHAAVVFATRSPAEETKPLVQELQSLMEQAQKEMEATGVKGFDAAFANLDEFIAYGMTNSAFQNVLKGMEFQSSQNKSNKLVKAMKQFIDSVAGLLFGRKNESMSTGMGILLTNVAGLLESSAKQANAVTNIDPINLSMTTTGNSPRNLSTSDIYQALAQTNNGRVVSSEFATHLQGLLEGIVNKLHGPFGTFKEAVMQQVASNPEDVFFNALASGEAPFASESLAAGFAFTQQEAFVLEQVEAVVRAGMDTKDGVTSMAYRELAKLYNEIKATTKVEDFHSGDWATATQAEKDEAQALHDFIFNIKAGADGKSAYLSRFAAMGLAHEGFNKILHKATSIKDRNWTGLNFTERLNKIFNTIMDWFAGKLTLTYGGQPAHSKLTNLVEQLVQIEAKKRTVVQDRLKLLEPAEEALNKLTTAAKEKLEAFGKKDFFKLNSNPFIRAMGSLTSAYAGNRTELLMEGIQRMRDASLKGQQGVLASLVDEFRGSHDGNLMAKALLRVTKLIEGIRKDIIAGTGKAIMGSFANKGDDLNEDHKAAISAVFLRTDMASLLGHYTMADLMKLVNDPAAVSKEIAKQEAKLGTLNHAQGLNRFFINSAKALGYYKATGKVTAAHLLMNAENIARLHGTGIGSRITEADARAVAQVVDPLVSLYALAYSKTTHLDNARAVLKAEAARTDGGNGVEMVLKTHKALLDKSKAELFEGTEALFMKGYLPEVYDPYMNVVQATEKEGEQLVLQGYIKGAPLQRDMADPDQEQRHLYHLRDGGLKPYLSGIFSFTGMTAKGRRIHHGHTTTATYAGQLNASTMASIAADKKAGIQSMFRTTGFNPEAVTENHLAPILDPAGNVVNYRYLMNENVKDTLLDRDNRPERLLGLLAGNIYDKVKSEEQNRKAVKALYDQYKEEFAERPESYLRVGPTSTDPQLREVWDMLPTTTQKAVKEIWGTSGMLVRRDLIDINFGYRKLSIAGAFTKDEQERSFIEGMFVQIMEAGFQEKAALRARQAEDIWQAIVKAAKANMVVKSWSTVSGNLRSNFSQLLLMGVSFKDIVKGHRVAFKAAWDHKQDSAKLFNLQHQLDTKYFEPGWNEAKAKQEVLRLTDAINRNPVKPLIDAGLMPTIVEDVEADDEIYSYQAGFEKKVDEFTSKINPHVKDVAREVLMAKGSTVHKAMNYVTQISDFLARYTLYQDRIAKGMSHEEAAQLASDAFVNYDVPTHRKIQYANDSGLLMFTKYYIRIQKMIMHIYRENPGRAMMMIAAEHLLIGNQPTVLDASLLVRGPGHLIGAGALDYPGSLSELTTMRLLAAPFSGSSFVPQ
jgi:hypothetical protein